MLNEKLQKLFDGEVIEVNNSMTSIADLLMYSRKKKQFLLMVSSTNEYHQISVQDAMLLLEE